MFNIAYNHIPVMSVSLAGFN